MTMEFTLIKEAAPMGERKLTKIDEQKANADILIEYCNGGSFTIKIQKPVDLGGKRGIKRTYANGMIEVTESKLNWLQARYNVQPNF